MDLREVAGELEKGVRGAHQIHVWKLDENTRVLEAHIVVAAETEIEQIESTKTKLKKHMAEKFNIAHST